MAAFCYRLWQLLPSLYVTLLYKYVTLLYVLVYIICYKLHNLKCNMLLLMSEFYIIRYVFFT